MISSFDERLDRIHSDSVKWSRYGVDDIIAMGTADMDFKTPEFIRNAIIDRVNQGVLAYGARTDEYFESIVSWYLRRYGWKIQKEWLSNSPGVWVGLRMCIDTFSDPGGEVLINAPYFHPLATIIGKSGRKMTVNPLVLKEGKYALDFEDLEEKLKTAKIYILISPQNPSGRVFTRDELTKIGDLCEKHNVLLISDEVHSNILYDGHKHIPYGATNERNAMNSIVISSVSKGFNLQGLTYAYLIIPNPELREKYEQTLCGYDLDFATNILSMAALKAAFNEGAEWLDSLNEYLQGNLDYMVSFFENECPQIKVIRPEGSYVVWLDCRELNLSPEELQHLFFDKAKVALTYGETFGLEGIGFERINIGCPRKTLIEGLNRIKASVQAL